MAGLPSPPSLPLRAFHEAAGAEFGAVEGAQRLVSYRGFEAEYGALCAGCALFDVSDRGLVSVSGEARARFLQKLLTNDVAGMAPGESAPACLLNRQSKVLSLMHVRAEGERFLLDVEPGGAVPLVSLLLKYRLSEPVELMDLTGSQVRFSLRGPAAERVASEAPGLAAQPESGGPRAVSWRVVPVPGAAPAGQAGGRVEIQAPVEAGEALWAALVRAGAVPAGWQTLETSRLEAGEPRYGADVTEETLFSEADLPEAVSHSKGCYIGQEIVTRVRTRGKVHRIRSRLLVEGEARPGDEVLLDGAPAGRITSCARSPRAGGWLAFACVRPQTVSVELRLQVRSSVHGPVPATLAPPLA